MNTLFIILFFLCARIMQVCNWEMRRYYIQLRSP
jgi:hypothetical protein